MGTRLWLQGYKLCSTSCNMLFHVPPNRGSAENHNRPVSLVFRFIGMGFDLDLISSKH